MFKGTFHYRTKMNKPLSDVWSFFQYNRNLAAITSFPKLTLQGDEKVFEGAVIHLKMNFFIIRLSWESKISQVQPLRYFIDEGEKLPFPFTKWQHKHEFIELRPGWTLMTDQVRFTSLVPAVFIKIMLYGMFSDRKRKLEKTL
ncbi:MAG: hypothetical protein EA344_10930 [Alkalicoccus sp.]|nr:MAG: hypothetical protein EA344_10930 [Alkalicoccus sp.]